MAAKFVAVDLGASSGRVIYATLEKNKFELHEIHRFSNQPTQLLNNLHWNIVSLYEEIKTGLTQCAKTFSAELDGIGIDTWGVDFGLVSENNELVGIPWAYRDARTNGILEKTFALMPREEIYRTTGIQFMQFNSAFQLLAMVQAKSPLLKATNKLLFMPDLLNFLFSGQKVTERSIASTSQLLNPMTGTWAKDIFVKLGLPLEIMPEILEPGTELGSLLPEIARETGLSKAPIIATAGHDTAAAVAAVPASGDNWAYLSSGTWSLMGIESPKPIINDQTLRYNFTNEGGVAGTIRFLKNISGLWLVQTCQRDWAKAGKNYDFATLTQMASQAKPFVAILDPDNSLFLNPDNMPEAIQTYLKQTNQPQPQTEGETIRIILESLALKYRHILEQINELRGKPTQKLHIVGGGTKNELLNQFAANACGIPVVTGPVEATAIGNIMVQAVTRKVLPSIEAAREVIKNSVEMKYYTPQDSAQWEKRFNEFKQLLKEN